MKSKLRRLAAAAVVVLLILVTGIFLLIRDPLPKGGYAFVLSTKDNSPVAKVAYLSYGSKHHLLTCGPREATKLDVLLKRVLRTMRLQRYRPAVAYLAADNNSRDSEVVIYAIVEGFLNSVEEDLVASYVAEGQGKQPMRFAIGKSNADGSRHLIAWKVTSSTPPSASDHIEIADVTGKLLATVSRMQPSGDDARTATDE